VTTVVIGALWLLTQPAPAPPAPTIDFIVTTSDGTPVTDIKPEELTIRLDGRPRKIRTLRLVSINETPPASTPTTPAAPFGTNALTSDGRSLVIAIDEDSFRTGREQALRESVDGLIARLSPADRVLVVTMPFGSVKIPFTTDHARIKRFISTFTGQQPRTETGSEMACRTRRVLEATAGFLGLLEFAQGPTSVVFFTGGMAGPRRDAIATRAPGMCELTAEHFNRVGRAAGSARANFYVVHPADLAVMVQTETISGTGFVGSDNPQEGIEHLAGVTGGRRLPLSSSGGSALARIAKETAAHYVAELEPDAGDGDTRSRQVNIRASRANVTVGFRPQVTMARRATAPAAPATSPESAPNARQMLMTTTPFGGLPLRAAAFTAVGTGGKVKVTALAEPVDPAAPLTAVMAALIDPTGRVAAQWAAPDPTEVPLSGAMLVDPGPYRLRVSATDKSGRGGAADYEFDAQLTPAGSLQLSSLILGISHGAAFVPRLQFGREPVALASLELSGAIAGPRLTLGLELARTTDGPAIMNTRLAIERIGDDHYLATGAIAIGALPPGDYVVRAVVGVEGQTPVRVTRTLRKVTP
jgi:VWFA-related protein